MAAPNQFDLAGKVAIVTGGNGGLGLGIALGLAGAGANIVIAARSVEKTAQALEEVRALDVEAHGITVDLTQEPAVQRMVAGAIEHMGRLDILVNNSGIAVRAQPQDLTAAQWDSVVDVNLRAAFLASKEAYSHMVKAGGGKVINVGSMYSLFGSDWGAPYAASKGGIVQLTKSLAVAWAKDNIQVNAVLPGWFVTDLTRGIPNADPERYDDINRRIPTGRWGEPRNSAAPPFSSPAKPQTTLPARYWRWTVGIPRVSEIHHWSKPYHYRFFVAFAFIRNFMYMVNIRFS